MARGENRTNPVILRQGMSIGTGNAESDDEFLFNCFVDYPAAKECIRIGSPGRVVSGRTGSGKTAIIRHIENNADHCSVIDPAEMSMNYVSNSDALRFLSAIGADLDLLFQILWKHVLAIEFIRLKWSVNNEAKSQSTFDRIVDRFRSDDRRKKSIEYLRKWEGKFWITMDQNIKEMTENVERRLHAEFGTEIEKFKAGGQYDKRLSMEKKSEIIARSRNIINADQLSELHGVIDILAENTASENMLRYYVLIDKLDERWVDDTIRFRMIRALLQCIRAFNKITSLKILISLRADILERVVQETNDITFQREKFEDLTINLRWTKNDLLSLVEKRINELFRHQYSGRPIGFSDIFTSKVSNKEPFDYILERTLMRPRDVIAFVNECIDKSDGHYEITAKHVKRAEVEYARKRRDALEQEWKSAFPTLKKALSFAASYKSASITIEDLCNSADLDETALAICVDGKVAFDPMFEFAQRYVDAPDRERQIFVSELASMLYRVGAVGLKLLPTDRFLYSHLDEPLISSELITLSTRLRIHPMLHGAFRLQELEDI